MKHIFLSIIVPVYAVEKYVADCVSSLFAGDTDQVEYIFVDDCTPDNSMALIREQITAYHIPQERVTLLQNDRNSGLSVTRNNGAAVARGTYLWFIDSDDWIRSGAIREIIAVLQEHNPQLLALCVERTDAKEYHVPYNPQIQHFSGIFPGRELLFRVPPCAQFYIFERDCWQQNHFSFFPGIYHEDTELTPRVRYLAERAMVFPGITYYYRITEGSIVATPKPARAFDLITVCANLYKFMQDSVVPEYQPVFSEIIAVALVESLKIAARQQKEDRKRYLRLLKEQKKVLAVFPLCPKRKHRWLGYLLNFPFGKKFAMFLLRKS